MSDRTQNYLFALWTLIDEILNSVLFLLIGLETLLRFDIRTLAIATTAIPIAIAARFVAISAHPVRVDAPFLHAQCAVSEMGRSKRELSMELALSLPDGQWRSLIIAATYAVVLFSIIVQGSTLGFVIKRTIRSDEAPVSGITCCSSR